MGKGNKVVAFKYGMRLRGFSPGCQPTKGLKDVRDDKSGKYYDILYYARKLTDKETACYELDYLGTDGWTER